MTFGDTTPTTPEVLLVGKFHPGDSQRHFRWLKSAEEVKVNGGRVFVDYTDNHLGVETEKTSFYRDIVEMSDGVIVPSRGMGALVDNQARVMAMIEDAVDFDVLRPKKISNPIPVFLWFGDPSNLVYLLNFLYELRSAGKIRILALTREDSFGWIKSLGIVPPANIDMQVMPWSLDNMILAAQQVDGCILPSDTTDPRKCGASANRLITALALGLPVAADRLESYKEFSKYFVDIRSAAFGDFLRNAGTCCRMVADAQSEIVPLFSKERIGRKWKSFFDEIMESAPGVISKLNPTS